MRAVFGMILVLGGFWLAWLVVTGLPFPWEDPNTSTTQTPNPANTGTTANTQASTVAPAGAATPGSVGQAGIRAGLAAATGGLA